MPFIYLASKNQHKAEEIQAILGQEWTVSTCDQLGVNVDWDETATTFRGNALIKAQALRSHTSQAVLADDSGLEVEILNGAPGVYSARYAGTDASDGDNLRKLLRVLEGIPTESRRARFVCVLCYIDEKGDIRFFEGHCSGTILTEAEGSGGFGYDPIFQPDGFSCSFGTLDAQEKNSISHRGKALAQFATSLQPSQGL